MAEVVVVGAGFSGCAAAVAAAKAGAEVILLEKTDMLGGLGLLTGVLSEGYFVAAEEAKALGVGDIFEACEAVVDYHIAYIDAIKRGDFHIFSVIRLERALAAALDRAGVKVFLKARAKGVKLRGSSTAQVILDDGTRIDGASFVDATGGSGTVADCTRYGFGCVMCIMRCPTFGGRVSISAKAGVKDLVGLRADGTPGALNSAFMLSKESLGPEVKAKLEKDGYVIVPLPKELVRYEKLKNIMASANAIPEYVENLCVFNTGYAKVMVQSYMPLNELRTLPGFENARMADPASGGVGNAVRNLAIAPRDNALRVQGLDNLYCAGEKAGPKSGIAACIVSGILAGHNAARRALGKEDVVLPTTTAIGDFIAYEQGQLSSSEGLKSRVSFGGAYYQRLKQVGLWSRDEKEIRARIESCGLREAFARRLA